VAPSRSLDDLDVALLTALREHPRAGFLELSRITGVARATVSARLQRLEEAGVVTGYGPEIDVAAAGFGVEAFVTLEIAQGALDDVRHDLEHAGDLLEVVADVVRSTSVIALSVLVPRRTLPLLRSAAVPGSGRSPSRR